MATIVYTFLSITNVASMHCSVRPEISPCTCEPIYANNYVELSCEKVDSFHQIVDALSNKFEPSINISLKISHSQLDDLEMRSFTDMNLNVVKLRMQWNGLKSVPELPFRGLSNVEFLSVGDNELEEIPKHMLNHMPIIKTFDMGRCRLRSVLSDDLKGIQMVMGLFLPTNNITRLERDAFPPSLVTLHLGRNQIESLNGTLRNLNKLESLFINMNMINTLDGELPEANRLKLIMAQNNRLERLPENMRYMNKLETLYLQFNRLKTLDRILKDINNLSTLSAFNNEIAYLAQDEFQNCELLEEIEMAFNRIKSLNSSLLPLSKLRTANFSFNEIEEFSMNEIRGLIHLKELDLSFNHIQKLTGRQENNIDQDSYLLGFNLDHNQLKSLDGALMGLNSLRILSLSYNQIERILPEDFIGLVKLEILDLSHNQLLTLQEMETTYLPSLKILKVAYNNLTKLDKDFHGLPVLCQANLTNNQIATLSNNLVSETRCMNHNVPNKLELHLEDNPIMCDVRLNEICTVMATQEARIRGRSVCFENDQEVCTALQMLFPPIILSSNLTPLLQEQLKQQVIPTNVKPVIVVPIPPLTVPLGPPPLLQQQSVLKQLTTLPTASATSSLTLGSSSTTTTTTTPMPTIATTATTTTKMQMSSIENEPEVILQESYDTLKNNLTIGGTDGNTSTTQATIILTKATSVEILSNESTTTSTSTTTTTLKPEILLPEELPPIILDIEEAAASQVPLESAPMESAADDAIYAAATDTTGTAVIAAPSLQKQHPQPEYVTMKYIPNLNEFISGNPIHPPDVFEEESKNSVHEEFPPVVLRDLDNAHQSLLIPHEPPENP